MVNNKRKNEKQNHRFVVWIMGIILLAGVGSCKKPKNEMVGIIDDKREIPTLSTEDVSTLISDSGVTKYRITAKQWDMYDKAKEPYWYFPLGLFVEKFDSLYQTEASIKSDTAYFYKNKRLWKLVGNVNVVNVNDEKFVTELLYWDQRTQRIYSDAFIHIERQDVILEGVGFESNESLTKYTIRTPSGIFPISDKPAVGRDSLSADSAQSTTSTLNPDTIR